MVHTFDPSTGEAKADKALWVPGQPSLEVKFRGNQSYIKERPCLQKRKMGSLPWEYNSMVELAYHIRVPGFDSKHYIKRKE